MDPFTLAFAGIGLATGIFGGISSANNAKQQTQLSQQMVGTEMQENNVRQQAMQVQGQRQQLEVMRNAQRQRAMAVQAGVTQGAQYGSGLAGGTASVTDQATFGLQGINKNLEAGTQMFGLSNQLSEQRIQMAALGGQAATDQGISTLGGAIMKSAPMLGPLASYGTSSAGSSIFGAVNSGGFLFQK